MPAYAIVYLKSGAEVGATPIIEHLETVKDIARDGLIRHEADEVHVRENDSRGPTVWIGKR